MIEKIALRVIEKIARAAEESTPGAGMSMVMGAGALGAGAYGAHRYMQNQAAAAEAARVAEEAAQAAHAAQASGGIGRGIMSGLRGAAGFAGRHPLMTAAGVLGLAGAGTGALYNAGAERSALEGGLYDSVLSSRLNRLGPVSVENAESVYPDIMAARQSAEDMVGRLKSSVGDRVGKSVYDTLSPAVGAASDKANAAGTYLKGLMSKFHR